ncbi:MAG: DUF4115 domain-containing protein [Chromatiaceae bacterium]|nr:DUF4115 domain-containing protein [Chromatiaceae bacterium]
MMTDRSEPGPDEDAVEATGAEPAPGPGQRLRQARLRRGLDLTQVARDLRLTPERVKAIENEDYPRLPGAVFVVGYVKSYARLLDLDPEALGEAYRAALTPPARKPTAPPVAPERQASRPSTEPSSRSSKPRANESLWAGITALLLVLILALAWWLQRSAVQATTSPPVAEKPVPDGLTQPQARVDEAAEDEAGADTSLDESSMEPLDEPQEEETAVIEEEAGAAANAPKKDLPAAPAASPSRSPPEADVAQVVEKLDVVISFTGPTSVDIRDSTMNYGLIGEMDQGDQHLLGGKPPYSLIIGNAAATRIQVGGQPFDFQSVVRGNVARFILDPAPKP